MATTTNYSWSTPDDTALVKDGAAAIRSLGTAIDTTVFNNAGAAIAKTIVDAKGDIIAATAADTVARLAVGANGTVLTAASGQATGLQWATPSSGVTNASSIVTTDESLTTTVYSDLTTSQSCSVTTGTRALVLISTYITSNDTNNWAAMSFAVSGASTVSASDERSIQWRTIGGQVSLASAYIVTGLTAGSNTFTAKFRSPSNTSVSFKNRNIMVLDMGS